MRQGHCPQHPRQEHVPAPEVYPRQSLICYPQIKDWPVSATNQDIIHQRHSRWPRSPPSGAGQEQRGYTTLPYKANSSRVFFSTHTNTRRTLITFSLVDPRLPPPAVVETTPKNRQRRSCLKGVSKEARLYFA